MMDVVVPSVGESITEVVLAKFIKKDGQFAKKDEPLFELESDKASVEVLAPENGIVSYLVKEGDTLKIGAKVCVLKESTEQTVSEEKVPIKEEVLNPAKEPETSKPKESREEIKIAASGLKYSKSEFLIDILEEKKSVRPKPIQEAAKIALSEDLGMGSQQREPLSKIRKTIAKRLVQVKNETAMLTTFNEVDLSKVVEIRNLEKDDFLKKHGLKLTYLPFFIKAAISALKEFPGVNAFIDGDDIVYNQNVHMGIAVSTDTGLVVPVIKNADLMSFVDIVKAINNYSSKARERKLSVKDMSDGTFTITNGGVFGSMLSTPILNPPQSAILGMHNIVDRPVAINGEVKIRPIMYLALSYDHRIIDGKESVSFLVHMKKMLEDPCKFILSE
jgi:2-oxoglutarate dehydrogenase E2 component (dihydrolipoamide succinyltransferase)